MKFRNVVAGWVLLCLALDGSAAQPVDPAQTLPVFGPSVTAVVSPAPLHPGDTINGPVSNTQPLQIVVSLKLRNEAELDAFIEASATPNAVMASRAMTSEDFLAEHAPTQAQADLVAAFLTNAGFQNTEIAPNRLLVSAYATAATAQAAFATSMVQVQTVDGRLAYANNDPVNIPAELADVVLSVVGLQNVYIRHTMYKLAQPGVVGPQPFATGTATGHNPMDWPKIYGANTLAVASGIPVGVVTEGSMTNTINNLNSFTLANGLPTQTVQVVGAGGTDTSRDLEWALDTQDIVAMTGGVQKLYLYDSASLIDSALDVAFNAAVSANLVKIINVSLGRCETGAPVATEDAIFKSAVAQGQTFSFSAGDDGADECGDGGVTPSWPASSQYVVAVGGTEVFTTGTTNWASEVVWNELAGGHGATGGSPSKFEAIPSWQKNVGQNGSSTHRGVPDIAFDGDPVTGSLITVGSGHEQVGGTSLSSPLFVGAWARIMQARGSALGFAAPLLYQVAAVPAQYAADFHDVTSGNNDGETAAVGWDYCTGFGSMIVSQFINQIGATKLVFTVEPATSYTAGAAITVKVSIENSSSTVITSNTSAVTLALSGGTAGAVLSGTKTVNAVAGVATFSNLSVDKVGMNYLLNATDGSLTGAASTAFKITVGAAKTVTFTTQPAANSNIGAAVTIPLIAHVVDAGGNPVSSQSITLSVLNNPGSSTLSVTTNPLTTDASGNVTFAGVSLNKVGANYTLKATNTTNVSATPATSNAFNIVAGAAKTVTFTTQPASNSNVAAGATIPIVAHVVDTGGNAVAAENISVAISNNAGSSTLSVTANPVATNANGDANFAAVSLNKVGTGYTLKATDSTTPAATLATSNAFNIVAGTPMQLLFGQQPVGGTTGIALTPAVTVRVLDANNNLVSADSHGVTLTITAGPGSFDPGATATTTFSNGVATFGNLVFDVAGNGYKLTATDAGDGLTSAASGAFNIAAGAPRLIFTTEPANVLRGNVLGSIAVTEDNGSGTTVSDNTSSVDFSLTTACGTFDLGSATMINGVATLNSNQRFTKLATGLTIHATSSALNGTSAQFSVVNGDLVFSDGFDGCSL